MATRERFDIRTVSAVGTLDFKSGLPSSKDKGFSLQVGADGNFELNLLATNFDDAVTGNFVDVTSLFAGGATITAAGWYRPAVPVMFGAVRLNVTSIQSTKVVNVAGSFS